MKSFTEPVLRIGENEAGGLRVGSQLVLHGKISFWKKNSITVIVLWTSSELEGNRVSVISLHSCNSAFDHIWKILKRIEMLSKIYSVIYIVFHWGESIKNFET